MPIIDWQASADALLADQPTETFYVLTVEGGIHMEVNGPYPTATSTLAAWTALHGAQDPETDAAFVVAVNTTTGMLVLV